MMLELLNLELSLLEPWAAARADEVALPRLRGLLATRTMARGSHTR